jgi:radical SAM superfamily enzyme YgiQ (UPF0313 family)
VGISLSSLRLDTFSLKLAEEIQRVRKTTLTFAPETNQRLRKVINKNITDEEIFSTIEAAFSPRLESIEALSYDWASRGNRRRYRGARQN